MKRLLMLVIALVPLKLCAATRPTFYGGLDLFGAGGVNKAFEDDASDFTSALNATGISASASVKATGGAGFRVGVALPQSNNFEIGGSLGLGVGPKIDQTFENGPFSVNSVNFNSNGETKVKTETTYVRILLEGAKKIPISEKSFIRLAVGAGAARMGVTQKIDTSGSATTLVSALGIRREVTDNWAGFTWEISPALVFPLGTAEMELGVRYAQFPTKKESDDMSKIEWKPFGIFANLRI